MDNKYEAETTSIIDNFLEETSEKVKQDYRKKLKDLVNLVIEDCGKPGSDMNNKIVKIGKTLLDLCIPDFDIKKLFPMLTSIYNIATITVDKKWHEDDFDPREFSYTYYELTFHPKKQWTVNELEQELVKLKKAEHI